jgi:hypothetical protein
MPDTSLGRALSDLVDDVEAGDGLRERMARRGRRRPRLRGVAAVLVVLALVGGVVVITDDGRDARPVVSGPGTSTTTTTVPPVSAPVVWPTAKRDESWRLDPRATAERFATEVLAWRDPRATSGPDRNGIVSVTDGQQQIAIGVTRPRGDSWSVDYAHSPTWPEGASVGIDGTRAEFHVGGVAAGAVSTTITYTRGGFVETKPGPSATFAPGDLSEPGSVVVLAKDASGHVVGAWATGFAPGPFAAS